MNLKKFFSRNTQPREGTTLQVTKNHAKHEIACDTKELEELITRWTKYEGWEFENFADFIELIGVKTPVKLSELNKNTNTFKCLTALNTEVLISLCFADNFEFYSEIYVTEEDEIRKYLINCEIEKGKRVPSVILYSRIIKRDGKVLKSLYYECFCFRTLEIDDTYILNVQIGEILKFDKKSKKFVLRNCEDVENYLLDLDNSLVVSQVCDTIMQLLGFSGKDTSNRTKILISYQEKVNKKIVKKETLKVG